MNTDQAAAILRDHIGHSDTCAGEVCTALTTLCYAAGVGRCGRCGRYLSDGGTDDGGGLGMVCPEGQGCWPLVHKRSTLQADLNTHGDTIARQAATLQQVGDKASEIVTLIQQAERSDALRTRLLLGALIVSLAANLGFLLR